MFYSFFTVCSRAFTQSLFSMSFCCRSMCRSFIGSNLKLSWAAESECSGDPFRVKYDTARASGRGGTKLVSHRLATELSGLKSHQHCALWAAGTAAGHPDSAQSSPMSEFRVGPVPASLNPVSCIVSKKRFFGRKSKRSASSWWTKGSSYAIRMIPETKNTPDPPQPKDEFVLKFVKP
jgi:hypothetical protein